MNFLTSYYILFFNVIYPQHPTNEHSIPKEKARQTKNHSEKHISFKIYSLTGLFPKLKSMIPFLYNLSL